MGGRSYEAHPQVQRRGFYSLEIAGERAPIAMFAGAEWATASTAYMGAGFKASRWSDRPVYKPTARDDVRDDIEK